MKPAVYSIIFNSIDDVQDRTVLLAPVTLISSGNDSIVDIVLEVPFRRVFEVTVLAYDCKDHSLTDATELGKIIFCILYENIEVLSTFRYSRYL